MGASTGLFGIIGAAIGFVIFNWNNMSYAGSPRNYLLCQLAFMLIITFVLNSRYNTTAAHLCGLVSGIFLGCCLSNRFKAPGGATVGLSSYEKTTKNAGYAISIGLAAMFIALTMFSN